MMEVMHHRVEEEVVVEQPPTWRPDDTASSGTDSSSSSSDIMQEVDNNGVSEKNVYFDKNEGMWKCHHCIWTYKIGNPWLDHVHHKSFSHATRGNTSQLSLSGNNLNFEDIDIPKLVNAVINNQNGGNHVKDEILSVLNDPTLKPTTSGEQENISTSGAVHENLRIDLVEESDEEVIELEFERAVEKVHTHTAYCPNCSSQITKVILRRKKQKQKVRSTTDSRRPDKPVDLFGCLSCFSIFIPSGNGLNPFSIFGKKGKKESTQVVEEKHESGDGNLTAAAGGYTNVEGNAAIKQEGSAFDLFGIFRKRENETTQDSQGNNQVKHKGESSNVNGKSPDNSTGPLPVSSLHVPLLSGNLSSGHDAIKYENIGSSATGESQKPGNYTEITPPDASVPSRDVAIDIGLGGQAVVLNSHGSKSLEIMRCIVYGGLMESIASLSVVSSAAASDAATLNIIAIGFATVISGLFIFGHNLMDLKNDNAGANSNQHRDKYEEVLGKRGHFLLHATFAVLSFLLFGLIPPVIYGFTFRESDNKDYKVLAVAAASFTCIFILAIAKAYVQRLQKFGEYVKTILYYVTMAVSVSGVSYAVGDLFKLLMERVGWFEPTAPVTLATPTWASY
ncbi:hypothetical protein DH2020_000574 [Rehmannia glutinosa]|uniref:Membrane protein of ER body-like protein n=1 Tax=Rehmannia glutinosa TaxID=99300 RepID=A0ABR0XXB9_REHGL